MYRRLVSLVALGAVLALAASAATATGADRPARPSERATLQRYAADTWRSFLMMLSPATGLPSDNVSAAGVRARYTSPTNIGTYLWSTLAARDLGIIHPNEARARIQQTLTSVERLERHRWSGQFYNWYDPDTGAKLRVWPNDGSTVYPFLSSVDNGWLAAALMMVSNTVPQARAQAERILRDMDFGFYYDPGAGLIRGGFWDEPPPGCFVQDNYRDRGPDVYYTCHHYGALNTEPRITSYLGIADGTVPPEHYFKMWRTFPDTCDWSWQEQKPVGVTRNYLGVDVFEGSYEYRGMRVVPSWGGSMFEALMPALFVPEARWGPRSWGVNHPLYVRAQIEHGLHEAGYGYWGFSPSDNPSGGYSAYGVDAIGMQADGYPSNNDNTFVDHGYGDCRPALPDPPPSAYTNGVVTPHASFLALDYAPHAALDNLGRLREDFAVYGAGGFFDAVNIDTGTVARAYLSLDQGMAMAGAVNALTGGRLQKLFAPTIEASVRPLIAMEQFSAGG
jgi:hypothetical protein